MRAPRVGAWEADFGLLSTLHELTGTATVEIGGRVWKGTIVRSGENKGVLYVRIVGGAGGLSGVLPPRAYQGVPLSLPIQDVLTEAGETLSPTVDLSRFGAVVQKWNRSQGTAGAALANLLASAGATWRVLPDGTVWVGDETWPASGLTAYIYDQQAPNSGTLDIVATDPSVYPGEVFRERRVSVVVHKIEAAQLRTRILWEEEATSDRLKSGLAAFVRSAIPHLDYLASYWCRVVGQNADGTLELQPDDARIPGLSNIPVRYGVPGVSAKVASGCRALLSFASGDPAQPFATVWSGASITEIVIGTGGNEPAALGTALRTELDDIWTAITGHTHIYSAGPTAGAVTQAASASTPPTVATKQTVESSKIKVAT